MIYKDQFIKRPTHKKPLTICVAGICQGGTERPMIVYCADRMASSVIEVEHGASKIHNFTDNSMVMISSSHTRRSHLILSNTAEALTSEDITIKQIARIIAKECKNYRREERERNVLEKLGFTSYQEFLKQSKELPASVFRSVIRALEDYQSDFGSHFMLFGIDTEPHIYIIEQNGKYEPYDSEGFATIGSGAPLAYAEMQKYMYHSDMPLSECLIRIYSAKKAAETMRGVGKLTDLGYLHLHEPVDNHRKKHTVVYYHDIVERQLWKLLNNHVHETHTNADRIIAGTIRQIDQFLRKRRFRQR